MSDHETVFRLRPKLEDVPFLCKGYLRRKTRQGITNKEADAIAFDAGHQIKEGDRSKVTLKKIVAWKNPDSRFWAKIEEDYEGNDAGSIEKALYVAVRSTDGSEAVRALTELKGVGVPTASAILTTTHPDRYTVIDELALRALDVADPEVAFYLLYTGYCRDAAARLKVDLRTLDRALWEWGKRNPPRTRR